MVYQRNIPCHCCKGILIVYQYFNYRDKKLALNINKAIHYIYVYHHRDYLV